MSFPRKRESILKFSSGKAMDACFRRHDGQRENVLLCKGSSPLSAILCSGCHYVSSKGPDMKNILLVDDNAYILEALALTFSTIARDCAVLKARNGKEAVEILQRVPVDLLLTDVHMPVMNGLELISHRNACYPQVPLFAMTGDASPEVMEQLNGLGVNECLEKPFNFEAVTRMIQKKLNEPLPAPHACPEARFLTA
jgi:CheY-like chemotaxis protein